MNEYKVVSLKATEANESDFNYEYHKKYINKIGKEKEHNFKSGEFKNFKLLVFNEDEQGRYIDLDWIHKDDLIEVLNKENILMTLKDKMNQEEKVKAFDTVLETYYKASRGSEFGLHEFGHDIKDIIYLLEEEYKISGK